MIDKGGKLIFESRPYNKDGEPFVQISITDTGTGLTRDQMDHVFNEFYKTDDSRHKLDSTGLGLTICRSIIEKHGGKIWADSHGKGTGTTIYFTIPSDKVVYTRSFT
jgi:signal transduction histidine kinase